MDSIFNLEQKFDLLPTFLTSLFPISIRFNTGNEIVMLDASFLRLENLEDLEKSEVQILKETNKMKKELERREQERREKEIDEEKEKERKRIETNYEMNFNRVEKIEKKRERRRVRNEENAKKEQEKTLLTDTKKEKKTKNGDRFRRRDFGSISYESSMANTSDGPGTKIHPDSRNKLDANSASDSDSDESDDGSTISDSDSSIGSKVHGNIPNKALRKHSNNFHSKQPLPLSFPPSLPPSLPHDSPQSLSPPPPNLIPTPTSPAMYPMISLPLPPSANVNHYHCLRILSSEVHNNTQLYLSVTFGQKTDPDIAMALRAQGTNNLMCFCISFNDLPSVALHTIFDRFFVFIFLK